MANIHPVIAVPNCISPIVVRNILGRICKETNIHAMLHSNRNLPRADIPTAKNLFRDFVR